MRNGELLVGVDGSPGSRAAIRFAAAEADRRGAGILLVHVAPSYLPLTELYPMRLPFTPEEFELGGREILAEALAEARHELPANRVRGDLVSGDRALALLREAEAADLVVLGADRSTTPDAVTVGSIVGTVAARAAVPVIAVPPEWRRRLTAGAVVVGLKSYDATSMPLLRGALDVASHRKAALRIVHVWELPATYALAVLAHIDEPGWTGAVADRIRSGASELLAEYDEVRIEIDARYGQPAEQLLSASADADLLVIARHAETCADSHFGSTGRALLRVSRCPVMVLPIAEHDELDEVTERDELTDRRPTARSSSPLSTKGDSP